MDRRKFLTYIFLSVISFLFGYIIKREKGIFFFQSQKNEDIYGDNITKILKLRTNCVDLREFGATGDGIKDCTEFIQKALDSVEIGEYIQLSKGDYKFSTIVIPTGVHIVSAGGRLVGGTIKFSKSIAQEYNTTIKDVWFKQCKFYIESETDSVNNITLENCFIDGTDINNIGTTPGDAVTIGKNAFDIKLLNTNICNYGGSGIKIQGNSNFDLLGKVYPASGVFIILSDLKVFNCLDAGLYLLGACADGTSVHMTNILIDHCGFGIYAKNHPRVNNAGEINIYGSNIRLELSLKKGIYNEGAFIFIHGLWSMGNHQESTSNMVLHNFKGVIKVIGGRVSSNVGWAAYNEDSNSSEDFIIEGLAQGGNYNNISKYKSNRI